MDNTIGIISEVVVLIFNVLIYMQLTVLKKDSLANKILMYAGSIIILAVFFVCTYFFRLPEAVASFVCVTLPTFVFFFSLSKYKDFRFFVSFCFLDTVTLIVTFFARAVDILWGPVYGIIGYCLVCIMMLVVYIKGKPYFRRYRELMENVHDGWGTMALSTFLIYLLLIFAAAYPEPLRDRIEYIPVYAFISVTILSFYVVFILSLLQKRSLYNLNMQLANEKKWHKIAYEDALTGMRNRMAYIERINELEREAEKTKVIHVIMMDIDNFKKINDTHGHHIGDITLRRAADILNNIFSEENYETFRIGGDEFAVIAIDIPIATLQEKLISVKSASCDSEVSCSFSLGYATVNFKQNNAMENAFIRADKEMYKEKSKNKPYSNI